MLSDMITPRLTELGKIKVGGLGESRATKGGGTFRLPAKYDHFVVTTLHRNDAKDLVLDSALMDELKEQFGSPDGKLRQLPIFVLSNEIDDIMQSSWLWYTGKSMGARSNGKTVEWFTDPKTGKRLPESKTEDWRDEMRTLIVPGSNGVKMFKRHTVFNCVIASNESRWGGVYKLRTTSEISSGQLYGSLVEIAKLTNGILMGVPLMLVVRPVQVAPDGKPTTVYVVHCELRGRDIKAIQQMAYEQLESQVKNKHRVEVIQAESRKLLTAPGFGESPRESAEVNQEFQPETASMGLVPTGESDPLLDDSPRPLPATPVAPEVPPVAKAEHPANAWEAVVEQWKALHPKRSDQNAKAWVEEFYDFVKARVGQAITKAGDLTEDSIAKLQIVLDEIASDMKSVPY